MASVKAWRRTSNKSCFSAAMSAFEPKKTGATPLVLLAKKVLAFIPMSC
jgi:hypothetical protein